MNFITLLRILSTGLLSHSGQINTVGPACTESNVLYTKKKKMLEGSGVKPLFLCVKVFVTVSFDISIRQADRSLVSGFVLGPYSSVFVCLGFFYFFFVNGLN